MKVLLLRAALLLFISGLTQAARVYLPNGELTEQQQDVSVKVLAGTVSLDRTWTNGRWYFNPAWSNLKFKRNLEEEVQYVDRAGTVYERTCNQGDVYVFDDSQFICRIVSSTGSGNDTNAIFVPTENHVGDI